MVEPLWVFLFDGGVCGLYLRPNPSLSVVMLILQEMLMVLLFTEVAF